MKTESKRKVCMMKNCGNADIYARGICRNHYLAMMRVVQKGVRKWEDFEDVGMCMKRSRSKPMEEVLNLYKQKNETP